MLFCTIQGTRSLLMVCLVMMALGLGGCALTCPMPKGLGAEEAELWQAMHGGEARVTVGGRVLREMPSRRTILSAGPYPYNRQGDRSVGLCVTESGELNVTMRGYWKGDVDAREGCGCPARSGFTGASVHYYRRPVLEETSQGGQQSQAPATTGVPADKDAGELPKGWSKIPSCTLLDADSNKPMEIACVTKDGRWLRKVDDNWYIIVALAGTRGLICWDAPGQEQHTGPYRRAFRRFSLRPYLGDAEEASRHCIEEHLPLWPSGGPVEPPLEEASEVELADAIRSSVLEAMKGKGRPLTLAKTIVTEAPRDTDLVGPLLYGSRWRSTYLFTETRIMEVSRYWYEEDPQGQTKKCRASVDLWLWPEINTDSGTGVWAQVKRPYPSQGRPDRFTLQSLWLDARTPGHMESLFVRPEAKASRQFVEDWSMALFVHNSDVLLVWRSNSTWKAGKWTSKSRTPDTGYRRLRIKGVTDPNIKDACGSAYLEELFPAPVAGIDAPRPLRSQDTLPVPPKAVLEEGEGPQSGYDGNLRRE